ncbi:hypothetical protein FISHEDRAFT_75053 [Fistulina hepatica ATCC 64428]|uniref:Uncharacterized protein n=1 Tax=Fistulina hepatica ATCC 64428 TaxID=1128425 RepID=A0A0D7AAQ2_9AGAR|nr:hypothetical protein FISHEDRAFT_75053 [Fistulina hepatica ATCC 64428]
MRDATTVTTTTTTAFNTDVLMRDATPLSTTTARISTMNIATTSYAHITASDIDVIMRNPNDDLMDRAEAYLRHYYKELKRDKERKLRNSNEAHLEGGAHCEKASSSEGPTTQFASTGIPSSRSWDHFSNMSKSPPTGFNEEIDDDCYNLRGDGGYEISGMGNKSPSQLGYISVSPAPSDEGVTTFKRPPRATAISRSRRLVHDASLVFSEWSPPPQPPRLYVSPYSDHLISSPRPVRPASFPLINMWLKGADDSDNDADDECDNGMGSEGAHYDGQDIICEDEQQSVEDFFESDSMHDANHDVCVGVDDQKTRSAVSAAIAVHHGQGQSETDECVDSEGVASPDEDEANVTECTSATHVDDVSDLECKMAKL